MKLSKRLQQSLRDSVSAKRGPEIQTIAEVKRRTLAQLAALFGPPVPKGPGPKQPGCHVRGGKWVRR